MVFSGIPAPKEASGCFPLVIGAIPEKIEKETVFPGSSLEEPGV